MKRAAVWLLTAVLAAGCVGGLGGGPGGVAAAEPKAPPAAPLDQRIWPDESIYFIMIDRFHNGDKTNDLQANPADIRDWHGGDLQGIIEKLDYIKSLGFTAIWITPHVKNTGRDYHGYGAIDFYDTDPHFGTVAQTRELVQQAHKRGMKVIFDIVVNHTGPHHPIVREKPHWFNPKLKISNWNDPHQVENGWIFDLPDFDQSKPEVREYILDYSRFWIEQTGVDGFRLDTVKHVPKEFWTWYSAELQKIKPGFWLIGEVWVGSPFILNQYQKEGVTALVDFPTSDAVRAAIAKDGAMSGLASAVRLVEQAMNDPWQMGGFLDNHDMPRFTSHAKDDGVNRLKLGLIFLFTQRSIPILYYGTEIAMLGANDPYNRVSFPWGQEQNLDVRDLVTQLNQLRKAHPALRRGTVEELHSSKWQYAYGRRYGSDTVVVALNNHAEDGFVQELDVAALGLADGTQLKDALTGKIVTVTGGKLAAEVGPRTGAIYVPVRTAMATWALGAAFAALGGGLVMARKLRRGRTSH